MAKQVVTETRINGSVKVELSYEFEPTLKGKKEREEVVCGNVTKYWVSVPDKVVGGVTQSWSDKQTIIANRRKIKANNKKAVWNKLQEEKRARIARYAEMAKKGELFQGSLQPTEQDIASAVKLQKMSKRAQNKTLGKI